MRSSVAEPRGQIVIRRGSVYLTAALYRRYFDGLQSVVLLRRADDLVIMPVHHAASGGYLLKLRNSAGDRVINATDFFTAHGIREVDERTLDVGWNSSFAGLVASAAFDHAN